VVAMLPSDPTLTILERRAVPVSNSHPSLTI
jgi:hypothetical protein